VQQLCSTQRSVSYLDNRHCSVFFVVDVPPVKQIKVVSGRLLGSPGFEQLHCQSSRAEPKLDLMHFSGCQIECADPQSDSQESKKRIPGDHSPESQCCEPSHDTGIGLQMQERSGPPEK
jgi:hypothetical protein